MLPIFKKKFRDKTRRLVKPSGNHDVEESSPLSDTNISPPPPPSSTSVSQQATLDTQTRSATVSSQTPGDPNRVSSVMNDPISFSASIMPPSPSVSSPRTQTPVNVPPSNTSPSPRVSNVLTDLKNFLRFILPVVEKAVSNLPVPGLGAIGASAEMLKAYDRVISNREDLKKVDDHCVSLMNSVRRSIEGREKQIPESLKKRLDDLATELIEIHHDLNTKRNTIGQMMAADEDSEKIKDMLRRIAAALGSFAGDEQLESQITGDLTIESIKQSIEKLAVNDQIRQLPNACAAFDSYTDSNGARSTCLAGTRESVLNSITTWIHDVSEGAPPIYVLEGLAGIGKSTIAQTVAQACDSLGYLGASFFFSRQDSERSTDKKFFGTIAFQLAQHSSKFAERIGSALQETPDAATKTIPDQMKLLIVNPLRDVQSINPVVIVIDALDECNATGADIILRVLVQNIFKISWCKVFITMRPEEFERKVLDQSKHYSRFILHNVEDSVVDSDIRAYLRHELSPDIVSQKLPDHLPWTATPQEVQDLVTLSGRLFIVASTAVKFILDEDICDPPMQVRTLLQGVDIEHSDAQPYQLLDAMYLRILSTAVPRNSREFIVARFRQVVGTLVLLRDPLSTHSLSRLLGMDQHMVKTALAKIHSVIPRCGDDQILRVFHQSFPDFITSSSRCIDERYLVKSNVQHLQIALGCFGVMRSSFQNGNTCDVGTPNYYLENTDLSGKQKWLREGISPELSYSCRYWASHLLNAHQGSGDIVQRLMEFANDYLLRWLEVLSATGHLAVAYLALEDGKKFCASTNGPECRPTLTLLNDCQRFVTRFYDMINDSAAHIFHSALLFTPRETELYRRYGKKGENRTIIVKGVQDSWDPLIAVLAGHSQAILSVRFSADGSRIASGSSDRTVRLWDGVTGTHIATLEGHSGRIDSVQFSADGNRLASGSEDRTVQLWDGVTGAHIAALEGHSGRISSVQFSATGNRLASGSEDETVRLWDGVTGAHIATLVGHLRWVRTIQFSADGNRLASVSDDKTVQLWNGVTGAYIATLEECSGLRKVVQFSAGGNRLASGSEDNTVQLWDGVAGAHIAALKGHSGRINSIQFSMDGSRVASASEDKTMRLWDGVTGAHIATLKGHLKPIYTAQFTANGNRLASGSEDSTVRLWDGVTGAHIVTLEGHSRPIYSVQFSEDGNRLVSGSEDNTVRLWDGVTGVHVATLEGHSVQFSPNGNRLVSGSQSNSMWLWDVGTSSHFMTLKGHSKSINYVKFSADGSRLVSRSSDNTVRLWDEITGARIATLGRYSKPIYSIQFSADGSRLVSGLGDNTVRLWDGVTGARITTSEGHLGLIRTLQFSADGNRFATGSEDNTVRLWNMVTGAHIVTLKGHLRSIRTVQFSADGNRLASGSSDNMVQLWDGVSGTHIAMLKGHSERINSVQFSLDGSRLASGSVDDTVRLWDGITGACIATLVGHSESINSVQFSADGNRLVSGSDDNTMRLWDGVTGSHIATLKGHSKQINSIQFSVDGNRLASGSEDNTVRLWDGATGAHIAMLKGHLGLIRIVQFSADGSILVSGSQDSTVRLWDGVTGEHIVTLETVQSSISAVAAQISSLSLITSHLLLKPPAERLPLVLLRAGSIFCIALLQLYSGSRVEIKPLCYLPMAFCGEVFAFTSSTVAIGFSNGKLIFICLSRG